MKNYFFVYLALATLPYFAYALPEESLGNHFHTEQNVLKEIDLAATNRSGIEGLRKTLSGAGVKAISPSGTVSYPLDDLWASRKDFPQEGCEASRSDCHIFSRFGEPNGDAPIVLLPGFTGYRKMYIEQILDLQQMGYSPIYVPDLIGTGDSGKNFLPPGQQLPTLDRFLNGLPKKIRSSVSARVKEIAGTQFNDALAAINHLPIGLGHVAKFEDYNTDVNNVMLQAVNDNPGKKITVTAMSMSGLVILMALSQPPSSSTQWISYLKTVVLESPMLRIKSIPIFLNVTPEILARAGKDIKGAKTAAGPDRTLVEFVNKALGHFDPSNAITHSQNRLTLTDGMRTWNGAETAGATFGWALAAMKAQYQVNVTEFLERESLNYKLDHLKSVFNENKIALVAVTSMADPIVEPKATIGVMQELEKKGILGSSLCLFQTSKHVIDQESDKYRVPYLNLLKDYLQDSVNQTKTYTGPDQEPLVCKAMGSPPSASLPEETTGFEPPPSL